MVQNASQGARSDTAEAVIPLRRDLNAAAFSKPEYDLFPSSAFCVLWSVCEIPKGIYVQPI